MLRLERLDLVHMLQSQANVVQPIQQTMLAERIYLKLVHCAVRRGNALPFQVDLQTVARHDLHRLEQRFHLLRSQADRQETGLEAITEKNVGETRRDDNA